MQGIFVLVKKETTTLPHHKDTTSVSMIPLWFISYGMDHKGFYNHYY
jgi:hypothetical protein